MWPPTSLGGLTGLGDSTWALKVQRAPLATQGAAVLADSLCPSFLPCFSHHGALSDLGGRFL
uniref:Uncharacterized protein n=1 Tax=Canis lupus familiaris TaxID=9615 RepID=A0A8C0NXS4_CANLF